MRDERQRDREALEHWAAIEQRTIREARKKQRDNQTTAMVIVFWIAIVIVLGVLPFLDWAD